MINDKGDKMTLRAKNGSQVNVRLEVNARARRLILRLDERNREAVAVAPSKKSLREAAQFAQERVDWIADRLTELPEETALTQGAMFPFKGISCEVSLEGPGRRARFEAGPPAKLYVPGDPETVSRRVVRFLKKEARTALEAASQRHCATLGTRFKAISVKDTRSRWGSCTQDGRLSYSWRLILAPPEVLDYVAAHECSHLIEMNHSPAFWAQVSKCCPDWKRLRKWLRDNGRDLQMIGV